MAENDPGLPHLDIGGHLMGTLSAEESESFRLHLETCPICARELTALAGLPALLGQAAPSPLPLPIGLEQKVFEALRREDPVRRPGARGRIAAWPRWRWNRPVWATLAAAAAVLVTLGAIHLLPPATQTPVETVHLVAADGGTAQGTARIQRTASGATIDLTIEGLRPPPPGQAYVCWLATGDGTDRIPIGRFKTPGPAAKTWRWTTTADTSRYSRMSVTRESEVGAPPQPGHPVLELAR